MAEAPKVPQPPGELQNIKPIEAPTFYFAVSQAFVTANDLTIMLNRTQPVTADNLQAGTAAAVVIPVAILQCGMATAKDLMLSLQVQVEAYEKAFGKIDTEYTRIATAAKK